jgi:hypothetical protein
MIRSLAGLVAALLVFSAVGFTQSAGPLPFATTSYTPPKTPWGDPDLQGVYTNSDESGIPMERPKEFEGRRLQDVTQAEMATLIGERTERNKQTAQVIGGTTDNDTGAGPTHWYENATIRNSRAWMVLDGDGRMPPTTGEARKRAAAVRAARRGGDGYYVGPFDGPQDLSLYVRCITRGVPGSMMPAIYGNSYDITQGPGMVAIRYEMVHETRVIPLNRRPHLPGSMKSYMGDARGWFEGNTLVVETTNVLEASAYGGASDQLETVERFTPTSPATIEWSITFKDARTWARPWTFGMRLTRDQGQGIFEYACHEGNDGLRGILSAARAEEREAAKRSKP